MPFLGGPVIKIHVLAAGSEFLAKRHFEIRQDFAPEQYVAGPALGPRHFESRLMARTITEAALAHPGRWLLLELRQDRSQHPGGSALFRRVKQQKQPPLDGALVIIHERKKFTLRVRHRAVTHQGKILHGLDAIHDFQRRSGRERVDDFPAGSRGVIIRHHHGVGKPPVGPLVPQAVEQTPEERRALERADANGDMGHGGTHWFSMSTRCVSSAVSNW